jgi:hypothetical protein
LPAEVQWLVLEFKRALTASAPCGVPGQHRLQFAGAMPADGLLFMQQAIDDGCEMVDAESRSRMARR